MMATDEHPDASPEARDAIERARRARKSTEAVMPLVDDLAQRIRRARDANHFAQLLEGSLREAARRGA